jgi:predicted ABC-type ATPase
MDTPYIIVIAGPNGVGKSTFAKWFLADLPDCAGIVDPDAIARELMELPEQQRNIVAGRLALERIDSLITERVSFASACFRFHRWQQRFNAFPCG